MLRPDAGCGVASVEYVQAIGDRPARQQPGHSVCAAPCVKHAEPPIPISIPRPRPQPAVAAVTGLRPGPRRAGEKRSTPRVLSTIAGPAGLTTRPGDLEPT